MTALPFALPARQSRFRLSLLALPLSLGVLLAGCAGPKGVDPAPTGSIAQPKTPDDFEKAVSYWGQKYQANAKDRTAALNYAAALRRTSRSDQAVAVLQKTAIYFPDDREVLAAYGKALASAGNLQLALETVQRAQTADRPDWQLLSAEAAIRDQMGDNQGARKLYAQALDFRPNEPSILSNFGMSYVLTGELPQAEKLLRQAMAAPGSDSRVRQNLALVVGLQGRFDEAEKIASAEMSPDQAAANVAYLKQMLAQQNNWQKLKAGGESAPKKKPG